MSNSAAAKSVARAKRISVSPRAAAPGPASPANREASPGPESKAFPIVGIGASAGGLEAIEQFLAHVPAGSDMGIVIVQHLDPTRKGIMPELLQRATGMKVLQVRDGTRVLPECVYVIPPNKSMSILHGVLHLLPPVGPRGLRLPIDLFFRSLAQDRKERSIGVILSGMGSDGTLGIRAIKEKAGVVLVQDPSTAKFDGMPRSAIAAGLADVVAPAEELPGKILAYLRRTPLLAPRESAHPDATPGALARAVILLRDRTGNDFSQYKKSTLCRRIERRMGLHQISRMSDYVRCLQENPQELNLLFKELLIGVTSFFRDPAAWAQLAGEALPALLAQRPAGQVLRAWVPGCSTGEEAYSLAMVFQEALDAAGPKAGHTLQVFATDLDRDAIDKARRGCFAENIAADVAPERLSRFFLKESHGYRVRKAIREMIIFAPQNLIMDPPFTKLDVLSCRNVMIYLAPEMQRKLIPLFHYNLNPGGILFLGSAETVGAAADLFAPLAGKARLYRRTESPRRAGPLEFPSSFTAPSAPGQPAVLGPQPAQSLQTVADQLVLQRYAPPAALVNESGDILYISGRTGRYLEPAAGKANWNIFAMAREGLRGELTAGFQKALRQQEGVTLRGLRVGTDGGARGVDVTLQRLAEPGPLQGLIMIVFTDPGVPDETRGRGRAAPAVARSPRVAGLLRELQAARQEARTVREEMQTSQEELRSTNEEMQSTNEELQSTNEELTTSKEEMQSLNEELQTVNTELQAKVDELSRSASDMKNLLNSTNIATLFLDRDLHVRRFTTEAAKIIKLIPGDVGRPITDLASDLRYPELARDAHAALQTLVPVERSISARDGRWFAVRVMPYRTLDDRIDGVVITFADVTAAKALEAKWSDRHASLVKRLARQKSRTAPAGPVAGATGAGRTARRKRPAHSSGAPKPSPQ